MFIESKEIARAFDVLFEACENIKDHDGCDECPLRYMCLEDSEESVIGYADLMSASSWDEFLEYADNVTFSEDDMVAQYADAKRKADLEERMIDDEYRG